MAKKRRDLRVVKPTRAEQKIIDRRLAVMSKLRSKRRLATRHTAKLTTTRTRFVERGLKKAGLTPAEIKKLRDK